MPDYRIGKRALDVLASALLLVLSVPIWVAAAVALVLEDGLPVLYRGRRIGYRGQQFTILKFRTMVVTEGSGPSSTAADDPRVNRVGFFLRRWKIDELPQLVNVLRGEMSLVGPRPQVAWDVERYTPDERRLLSVRPGLTDWASIRFRNEGEILRGATDADAAYDSLIRPTKIALGLYYVDTASLMTDLRIIVATVRALMGSSPIIPLGHHP